MPTVHSNWARLGDGKALSLTLGSLILAEEQSQLLFQKMRDCGQDDKDAQEMLLRRKEKGQKASPYPQTILQGGTSGRVHLSF